MQIVSEAIMTSTDDRYHESYLDVTPFGEEEWDKIKMIVEEGSEDAKKAANWLKFTKDGKWEALTAVNLSLTPNMQNLEFEEWFYTDEVYSNLYGSFLVPVAFKSMVLSTTRCQWARPRELDRLLGYRRRDEYWTSHPTSCPSICEHVLGENDPR